MITLLVHIKVNAKDLDGRPWWRFITKSVKVSAIPPVGSDVCFNIPSSDDPITPNLVTVDHYSFYEDQEEVSCYVEQEITETEPFTIGGLKEMCQVGGWTVT